MTYRLSMLAFGCAAAALGSALPVAALHAEETVPGMLRCFENGQETATIGPIFRVWSASSAQAVPPEGTDGCHWQPMTRIAMPGDAPPPQAIVSTEADETAAPGPTAAAPERAATESTSAATPETAAADVVPPVVDRSTRLPIDLAVAAELTAEAIAVEATELPPPPATAATGPAVADAPPAAPDSAMPGPPIVVDLALSLEPASRRRGAGTAAGTAHAEAATSAALAATASRPDPHPPLSRSAPAPNRLDPRFDMRVAAAAPAAPELADPLATLLLAGLEARAVGAAGSAAPPVLLAAALPAPAPDMVASAEARARSAAPIGPRAGRVPTAVAATDVAATDVAPTHAVPTVMARTAAPARANPHAGLAMPQAPRSPVVLASATPEGHRPNPHPDLPEGWADAPAAPMTQIAAELPRRGNAAMAGTPSERGTPAVTLPGWRLPAPVVPIRRSAAVPPAEAETLVAEAASDDAQSDESSDESPNKLQTANRAEGEESGAEELAAGETGGDAAGTLDTPTGDLPVPERARIDVAQTDAVDTPDRDTSVETMAAVAAVRAPAGAADTALPSADPATPIAASRGALPTAEPTVEPAADSAVAVAGPVPDGWWLQLASLGSPERAVWEWNRRTEAAAGQLEGHAPTIVRAEIEGRGTFYRLWVGPFAERREAGRLCARIEGPQAPCFVHRMDGEVVPTEVASR